MTILLKNNNIEIHETSTNTTFFIQDDYWTKKYMNLLLVKETDVGFGLEEFIESYETKKTSTVKTDTSMIGVDDIDTDEKKVDKITHIFKFNNMVSFKLLQKWKKTRKNELSYSEVSQFVKDIGIFMNMIEVNELCTTPFISLQHIFVMEVKDILNGKTYIRFIPIFIDETIPWYPIQSTSVSSIETTECHEHVDTHTMDSKIKQPNDFYGFNVNKRIAIIDKPIDRIHQKNSKFISHEWKKVIDDSIKGDVELFPQQTTCTNWVYSLGLCAIYLLTYNKSIIKNELSKEQIFFILEDILHTPLYSCILRCLEDDIMMRIFMFL